jgi:hypothetical protein
MPPAIATPEAATKLRLESSEESSFLVFTTISSSNESRIPTERISVHPLLRR